MINKIQSALAYLSCQTRMLPNLSSIITRNCLKIVLVTKWFFLTAYLRHSSAVFFVLSGAWMNDWVNDCRSCQVTKELHFTRLSFFCRTLTRFVRDGNKTKWWHVLSFFFAPRVATNRSWVVCFLHFYARKVIDKLTKKSAGKKEAFGI